VTTFREYNLAEIAKEEGARNYWITECQEKPFLAKDGFPGRGNEVAIHRLEQEIDELRSLLKRKL